MTTISQFNIPSACICQFKMKRCWWWLRKKQKSALERVRRRRKFLSCKKSQWSTLRNFLSKNKRNGMDGDATELFDGYLRKNSLMKLSDCN